MRRIMLLSFLLCLSSSGTLHVDFRTPCKPQPERVTLIGTSKCDGLGLWNIWPSYAGAEISGIQLTGSPLDINLTFSPSDTDIAWLDGHLLSLRDASNHEIFRIDMVRRGRFRMASQGRSALSRQLKWSCTVVNWENLAPRTLTVRLSGNRIGLLGWGHTLVSLDQVTLPQGSYTLCLGHRRGEADRGALGWYSQLSCGPSTDAGFPPVEPLPGKPEWSKRVDALERRFMPSLSYARTSPGTISSRNARLAAFYLALDGLWFRLHRDLRPGFEYFLTQLEGLAAQLGSPEAADTLLQVPVPGPSAGGFLSPKDDDYYYGVCGWGLGAYAPELSLLGINIVSEHIWPHALLDRNGQPMDCMLIRRTMPQLEEFQRHNVKFDLMIAPYTPGFLLDKHPEWEGTFVGFGTENEAEKLRQHAAEWRGRQAGHGFLKASVIAPDYRDMCRTFLAFLLPYVRKSNALVAIDLANEVQFEDYSPRMQARFHAYLQQQYGTIQTLNAAWKSDYRRFDDILMVRPMVFDRTNAKRYLDWLNCNRQVGTEYLTFLRDLCHTYAPGIPTHIKHLPHEFGTPWYDMGSNARNFYDYADGIDRKALAGLTEIIGTDSWADNDHDASGRLSCDVPLQTMYFNLLRSYEPSKWIFDSEWHIIRCSLPATPPQCLDMVMRQNSVHGLRAGTFWVCCPGNGQEMELSSNAPLLLQAGLTNAAIRGQRHAYRTLAQRPKRFGVLYSPTCRQVGGDIHVQKLLRYFEAGMFSGVEMRLVDERQLMEGRVTAADLDLLVLVECPLPDAGLIPALRTFASAGGNILQYGDFGSRLDQAVKDITGVRQGSFEENDTKRVLQIQADAREFGCAPRIRVTSPEGKNVWGIEYHEAISPTGQRILYIANMTLGPQTLRIWHEDGSTQLVQLEKWGTYLREY